MPLLVGQTMLSMYVILAKECWRVHGYCKRRKLVVVVEMRSFILDFTADETGDLPFR